jgi:hypothetical protein
MRRGCQALVGTGPVERGEDLFQRAFDEMNERIWQTQRRGDWLDAKQCLPSRANGKTTSLEFPQQ